MIQYGDITTLSGHDLAPVDLIVGGSPCQDLSVAGKRAGLDGARSGLFLEMIRIIREMREKTNGLYPRFALWENVPGAFSSNTGRDFSAVLGEFARLVEPKAPDVPVPQTGWSKAGILLVGDGQIAWRTHDAQYWGVPQRRRRIALVADLRGQSAAEILFERKSMPGDIEPGRAQREDPAGTTENSAGETGKCLNPWDIQMKRIQPEDGVADSLCSAEGNNQPLVVATMQGFGDYVESDTASSCKQRDYKDATDLVYSLDRASFHQGVNAKFNFQIEEDKASTLIAEGPSAVYAAVDVRNGNENSDVNGTLQAKSNGGWNANSQNIVREHNQVRRLTPLECERLQGYPDGWTDIPGASDSKRYKALGNSIALPFWEHLAKRFAQYGKVQTIGSLFDGIGGFPLCFKRAGCETLWTSEIEPFCQKVVAYHTEWGDLQKDESLLR